jgi:hypothetical protein
MTAAADLWTAVKASYDSAGLLTLTNIRNRAAVAINDTAGTSASQAVIDLWPIYAQAAYDPLSATNIELGKLGVIAVLWRRGGTSSTIEQVKWDEVFGQSGAIANLRRTGARGHAEPKTNSGALRSPDLTADGRPVLPWSDRRSMPPNFLPTSKPADGLDS